jgi:hypothetical protein
VAQGPEPRRFVVEKRNQRICHILTKVDPVDARFDEQTFRFDNRPSLPDVECP